LRRIAIGHAFALTLALAFLLHLLGQLLCAVAQAFQRPALSLRCAFHVALPERALGFAHGLLGLTEAGLARHALALHAPLHFAQAVAQLLLALGQLVATLLPC
jgi:hypothetical protein